MPNVNFQEHSFAKNLLGKVTWLVHRISRYKNYFITEKIREVYPSKYAGKTADLTSDVAILLQGQIIEINNFTFETINLYKKNFPNAYIVLSTWESERKKARMFEKLDIEIIYNVPLKTHVGYKSTNLQIISSKNGLKKIKEKKIKYSIKTRTDQRFGNPEMLIYLKSLLKYFTINNQNLKQEQRLIGISFNSFLYRLYGLSDMFLFGRTNDVYNYWNCSLDERKFTYKEDHSTKRLYSLSNICEIYFMTEFLKSRGVLINWTLRQSWDELAARFIIVDSSSLDFFWPKYSFLEDRWKLDAKKEFAKELSFSTWLRILENKIICDESLLDIKN